MFFIGLVFNDEIITEQLSTEQELAEKEVQTTTPNQNKTTNAEFKWESNMSPVLVTIIVLVVVIITILLVYSYIQFSQY